jgi:hypothetical protein
MEKLITIQNKTNLNKLLTRIGDIVYFDGPLLSLFENVKNGHLFLVDWIDRDESHNRWLVYRTDPVDLREFINGKISHLKLFNERPNKLVYVVDIPLNGRITNCDLEELWSVPEEYLPNSDSFFEDDFFQSTDRVNAFLNRAISNTKLTNEIKSDSHYVSFNINWQKSLKQKNEFISYVPITLNYSQSAIEDLGISHKNIIVNSFKKIQNKSKQLYSLYYIHHSSKLNSYKSSNG